MRTAWRIPFAVVLMVPSIEAIFFMAPQLLERAFGKPISPELLEEGRRQPKQVLHRLYEGIDAANLNLPEHLKEAASAGISVMPVERCRQHLTPDDLEVLRKHPAVQELNAFLMRVATDQLQPA